MKINLKNDTGAIEEVSTGFAIDIAAFGPIIYLWRKKFMLAILTCIPGISVGMAFIDNEMIIKKFLSQGFKPADNKSREVLQKKKIINEDGTFNRSISSNKKLFVSLWALVSIMYAAYGDRTTVKNIDLDTANSTVNVDELNHILITGTELQQSEALESNNGKVLEYIFEVENVESDDLKKDCVVVKTSDESFYITPLLDRLRIFKTETILCANNNFSKDDLISISKGEYIKIKGVINSYDDYKELNRNLEWKKYYIIDIEPAILLQKNIEWKPEKAIKK